MDSDGSHGSAGGVSEIELDAIKKANNMDNSANNTIIANNITSSSNISNESLIDNSCFNFGFDS